MNLQQRIAVYNGVAVRNRSIIENDEFPDVKEPLLQAIKTVIKPDDEVVHVGGGKGIAVVKTAEWAYQGEVRVYEAAQEMISVLNETKRLNQVGYDVIHGFVGTPENIYGELGEAEAYQPAELAGDLLVLDCEGAERDIVPVSQFDRVVVETHPDMGAPTKLIRDRMNGSVFKSKREGFKGGCVIRE